MTRAERIKYWAGHLRGIRSLAFNACTIEDRQRLFRAARFYMGISRIYVPKETRQ